MDSHPILRIGHAGLDAIASLPADVATRVPTLTLAMGVRPRDIYTLGASALTQHRLNEYKLNFTIYKAHLL